MRSSRAQVLAADLEEPERQYSLIHSVARARSGSATELLTELKAKKADIEELNKHVVQNSKSELQKNVHTNVVDEIKQKRQSIQDFANYAASQQPDNFRAQTHPALVNEILTKRDSIEGLTKLHNQKSGLIDVA